MNDDTVKELLLHDQENFNKVFAILETVVSGLSNLESRVAALEAQDAITKPLWQEMRVDQKRILDILQEHSARMDRIEARMDRIEVHLKQQDERFAQWDEQMDIRFCKLTDKFELLQEDTLEWRADVRELKRRVVRLEPVN